MSNYVGAIQDFADRLLVLYEKISPCVNLDCTDYPAILRWPFSENEDGLLARHTGRLTQIYNALWEFIGKQHVLDRLYCESLDITKCMLLTAIGEDKIEQPQSYVRDNDAWQGQTEAILSILENLTYCHWQGWRKYTAAGTCSGGVWSGKAWEETGIVEGTDWGWQYVPLCEGHVEEPGTVTGGDAVDCDGMGSLAYKVGTEIVVWGPVHAHTVDKTLANLGITAPSTTAVPITGELSEWLHFQGIECVCVEGEWDCDEYEGWERGAEETFWDCVGPPRSIDPGMDCEENDFVVLTWLGRTITCLGVTPPYEAEPEEVGDKPNPEDCECT